MKPWMLQSRRAHTGTAAPIMTSHVVALEDIVYGGGGSHGGGGYWELGPDWRTTTSLIPSQAASQARAVAISNGLVLGEQGYGIIFLDTVGMTPSATSSNIPPATRTAMTIPGSDSSYQARVDFWGGAAVGEGGDNGVVVWRATTGKGNISAAGTISTGEGFYWGDSQDSDTQYLITKDRIDLTLGQTVPHTVAGLVLTPPQASLPDTHLTGKYIGVGDVGTDASCNKFTVTCKDYNSLAPEIWLRTWIPEGGSGSSMIKIQAEAAEENAGWFFGGVGVASNSGNPSINIYGIEAHKDPSQTTGSVFLRLGSNTYEIGAPGSGKAKTFIIPHPLDNLRDSTELLHSCVEAPTVDNIYRGSCRLMNGKGIVNLDSNDRYQMTQGTFQALNKDSQVHVTNNESFDRVKGEIIGNELHIICENPDSDANIAWLVIGTRHDPSIRECPKTDEMGNLITERPRN